MGRSPCCEKLGLKKGPWTPEEDQKLLAYIEEHGHGCWRALPAKAGLQRCGKSCRLRWTNYLRPDIKRGKFSVQEEQTIIQLHALLGNRWSAIASHLPKRTDNEIKNFWNTHLKKRLAKMGIDPVTHKPRCDALSTADSHASKTAANLSHMAQWESARLEAEARLVRESTLLRLPPTTSLAAVDLSTASVSSTTTPPFQLPPLNSATALPIEMHNALPAASSTTPLPPCFDVLSPWQAIRTNPTRGAIGDSQGNRDVNIDLESPTSTLSFSESVLTAGTIGLVDHHNSSAGRQCAGHVNGRINGDGEGRGEEAEGEEVDWKCFPKPMQLLDTKERTGSFVAAAFAVDSSSVFGADNASSWLHDSLKRGPGPAAGSAVGHFGDGFTEMLLSNSDEHHSSEGSGGCTAELASGARKGSGENEEENKNYWTSILNLVSSVPSSSPSDCVLV